MSPFRATARLLLAGAASVALASCSAGDPATPPPPPPPGPKVTQVTLTPSSGTLQPGTTIQLTATAEDSAGATVYTAISWASSDTTIAVVSSTGMVTGRAVGQVQISATAATVTNSAQIKVAMATSIPAFDHVFVVFLENRDLADVIGNTGVWPYLNTLAHRYDYATEYRGATHPSIGNYFTATTGDTVTNDDLHSSTVSVDNLVRRLIAANKTWKSYAENLPSAGYIGGDNGLYWRYHNPFSYFSDVRNSATQRQNLVPFTQLSADLAAGTVPNFAFLLPNGCDDGHDCTDAPDKWLQANIEPLINSALFKQGNSLLVITWDESVTWSNTSGNGWRIPFILVSTRGAPGFVSTTPYTHTALLRLSLEALGITDWPAKAASAPSMAEFFRR